MTASKLFTADMQAPKHAAVFAPDGSVFAALDDTTADYPRNDADLLEWAERLAGFLNRAHPASNA
jgi:ABC-type uncharacterized transport system YnjBCD substrate-binding protein